MIRLNSKAPCYWSTALLMPACLYLGCTGDIGANNDAGAGAGNTLPDGTEAAEVPRSGLRRVTSAEYYMVLKDLLQTTSLPVFETLPTDPRTPFDNDYTEQTSDKGLIDAVDFLAGAPLTS